MEAQNQEQVYDEIVSHIDSHGFAYSKWYCGIASDWKDRLFNEHQVPTKGQAYIARQCFNNNGARVVEKALIGLGIDGGGGGGDESTIYVYAYHKGTMTAP